MKISKLIKDDWTINKWVTSNDAVLQSVTTRIKSFKNNWYLDLDANIDWLNILATKNNLEEIVEEVKRVVNDTDGVIAIFDIKPQINNRKLILEFTIKTVYNDINKIITTI